jgi:hypothetical protein
MRAALLPPSTNSQYRGSMFSAGLLTVVAVLTIVPGLIHTFLPDGGAGSIAGLDLGTNPRTVIGLFAWAGATQIALGIVMLAVSLRYRSLVPLLLGVVLLERTLHALDGWVLKGPGAGHHPPEHYAVLVGVPLLAFAFAMSLHSSGHERLDQSTVREGQSTAKGG